MTIDKSGTNFAWVNVNNANQYSTRSIGTEPDHRAIKRIVRPMLGFTSFRSARVILGGIELMHTKAKGQTTSDGGRDRSTPEQFYDLAKLASYSFRPATF